MRQKLITTLLFSAGLFFIAGVKAQASYSVKHIKVAVLGTSSLHDWESDVTQVECTGFMSVEKSLLTAIKDVIVKIPVTSIKSTKGSIMDNKTYDAFDHKKHPFIQYKLTNAKINASGSEYVVIATGNLTMAGITKTLEMTVNAKVLTNGDVQISGSKTLNMREYSMVPPTALMGTIKVGEEITIKFETTLTPDNKLSKNN